MEILFVSHKYPPFTGGMEKQSFELINGMKKHATVYAIVYEGQGSKLRFFLSLKKKIYTLLRQHPGISVIHYNDGTMAAWCSRFTRFPHIRRTATLHGLDVVFPNRFYQRYLLPRFNRFYKIITVSRATAKAATERGILPKKLVTIANGVDTRLAENTDPVGNYPAIFEERYGHDIQSKKLLVAMGRPVRRKGFSWFTQQVLPQLGPNVLLVLVGPFRQQETTLTKLLRRLPAAWEEQITLLFGLPSDEAAIRTLLAGHPLNLLHLGRLPFSEIQQLLRAADAFVMPNIAVPGDMEGFGLVCLEASLCGAPVFAAAIDGIPDAIHNGKNGYLLPAGDAAAWAAALHRFLDQTSPHNALGNAQEYTQKQFGWEKMVQGYYAVFAGE